MTNQLNSKNLSLIIVLLLLNWSPQAFCQSSTNNLDLSVDGSVFGNSDNTLPGLRNLGTPSPKKKKKPDKIKEWTDKHGKPTYDGAKGGGIGGWKWPM